MIRNSIAGLVAGTILALPTAGASEVTSSSAQEPAQAIVCDFEILDLVLAPEDPLATCPSTEALSQECQQIVACMIQVGRPVDADTLNLFHGIGSTGGQLETLELQ